MPQHKSYIVFAEGAYRSMELGDVVSYDENGDLYSARLGTGILGNPHCSAGNRGPAGSGEVLFAVGDEGLRKLIKLGFRTCPVCKPHESIGFWIIAKDAIMEKYPSIKSTEYFAKLPFDARDINWEELAPIVGLPGRLYVPKGLSAGELAAMKTRFGALGVPIPKVGWYDCEKPERFSEYIIA
jgi:hypothetical protein